MAQLEIGDAPAGSIDNVFENLPVGADVVAVRDLFGVGPDHQVAPVGRRDQNTLSLFGGGLKDHMVHHLAVAPPQNEVLALPGVNSKALVADHRGDPVGIYPGGIHHEAGLQLPVGSRAAGGRAHRKHPVRLLYVHNLALQPQFQTVGNRVLRQGNTHLVGRSNRGFRAVERRYRLRPHIWFELLQLGPLHDLQTLDSVQLAVLLQPLEGAALLLRKGQHQRSAALQPEVELLVQPVVHPVSADAQLALQRPVLGGISAVDNRTVGLGGAVPDIHRLLAEHNIQLVARELPGNRAADHSASYNAYIVHTTHSIHSRPPTQTRTLTDRPYLSLLFILFYHESCFRVVRDGWGGVIRPAARGALGASALTILKRHLKEAARRPRSRRRVSSRSSG